MRTYVLQELLAALEAQTAEFLRISTLVVRADGQRSEAHYQHQNGFFSTEGVMDFNERG